MWDFEGFEGLQGGAQQDRCQHHRHPLQGFGGGGTVKFVKAVHGGQRRLKKAKTKNVNLCFFLATSLLSLLALPSKATECVCDAGKKGALKPPKRPFCNNKKKDSQLTQVSPGHAFLPRSPGHHNQWQAGTERGAKGLLWHRPRCHRLAGHHQLCPDRRAAAGQGRLSER